MQALQHLSGGFFGWLWRASWQAAVVVVLVLVVQWLFAGQLTPRWRHALWLLVVIRLILPVSVGSPVSLFNFFSPHSPSTHPAPTGTGAGVVIEAPGDSSGVSRAWAPPARSWVSLRSIWLIGAVALAGYLLASAWQMGRRIRRQRPVTNEAVLTLLEDCKQEMGVLTPLVLLETSTINSPALLGFIRPRLLLPEGLIRSFSLPELRFVFLHELGHLKRGDILLNWLLAVPLVLHWFNPLVWYTVLRMRADGEAACDVLALSYTREGENQSYGQTIIKLIERFSNPTLAPGLVGILENKNQMKRRIGLIAAFKKTHHWPVFAVSLFAILALVVWTDAQSLPTVGAGHRGSNAGEATAHRRPWVVASFPRAGDSEVDPAITEISVTFDRDMAGGFSWTGRGPGFVAELPPAREGQKPHWRDRRTCVFPVKLQAGHYYRIGINSTDYQKFRDTDNQVAAHSVLYFTTQGASEADKARLNKPRVVNLTPANGATDVDPDVKELRVTFDVPMYPGYSWIGVDDPYLDAGKKAFWIDDRTCVLPVGLKPNHRYDLGINSDWAINFQSANGGVPADPINYTFKTKQ